MSAQPQAHPSEPTSAPAEGIDLILHLARTGEVDPWNVDIAALADQFLAAVAARQDGAKQGLKVTGKTLLYLAILLRMKSDRLAGRDFRAILAEPDEFLETLLDDPDEGEPLPPQPKRPRKLPIRSLDEALQRRTSAKQPRIRPVTLQDLIDALQQVEALEQQRSLHQKVTALDERRQTARDYSHLTTDDIADLAHEEFSEAWIAALADVVAARLAGAQVPLTFTQLLADTGEDRVSTFIALLFLAAREAVDLEQSELYGEFLIQEAALPAPPED